MQLQKRHLHIRHMATRSILPVLQHIRRHTAHTSPTMQLQVQDLHISHTAHISILRVQQHLRRQKADRSIMPMQQHRHTASILNPRELTICELPFCIE